MPSDHNWIGLMAKMPELGKVKTRLAADVGPEYALNIYKALLKNCINQTLPAPGDLYRLAAFVTPFDTVELFSREFPGPDLFLPQADGSLGQKMIKAMRELFNRSSNSKAVLIGADIPDINSRIISKAMELLDSHDVVFGPTGDGGYYLIGMKGKIFESLLSDKIDWGTEKVLRQSIAAAEKEDINYVLLERLDDLDDSSDLKKFPAIELMAADLSNDKTE